MYLRAVCLVRAIADDGFDVVDEMGWRFDDKQKWRCIRDAEKRMVERNREEGGGTQLLMGGRAVRGDEQGSGVVC